jgi:bifunctional DNA-binding transcriptional regulator/antitoxin component of YhaV-PrlF toxin-antitoxin module
MIRSQLGLADGDLVEIKVRSSSIVLTPKVVIDRSKFPNADDEYTHSAD